MSVFAIVTPVWDDLSRKEVKLTSKTPTILALIYLISTSTISTTIFTTQFSPCSYVSFPILKSLVGKLRMNRYEVVRASNNNNATRQFVKVGMRMICWQGRWPTNQRRLLSSCLPDLYLLYTGMLVYHTIFLLLSQLNHSILRHNLFGFSAPFSQGTSFQGFGNQVKAQPSSASSTFTFDSTQSLNSCQPHPTQNPRSPSNAKHTLLRYIRPTITSRKRRRYRWRATY